MAKKEKVQKTNAMRELERGGISYELQSYDADNEDLSTGVGVRISEMLGEDPESAFKTLVTVTPSGGHVVCCVPVAEELDLKKAAAAAGEKSLSMMHMKDLEPTTGYVRGGCTPVGMKKQFPTLIDETAQLFDLIGISGGRRGISLRLNPEELADFIGAQFADICR
ncbi:MULTISPECIES: Cys-tRNA(Pro) deacylase [Atopobiaceae]|uniref:Cys-tRNA(Pro)/Cys-tRNA(Cys) deacylase n=1 Tax=Parafannyhessea umbonata TaxID=604330 RepID=A0A1H6JX17_9ACTN|nr:MULTISPECIES: Cys-tRNA(Pro) deacylase [Atopobiaceae]SEH66970.1 Cys-tRNA(Pro)/Cys-tRNA(Cys) deacylase [Parafannyhessea umbonata]SJZ86596.1 Cys-tRNA(Pro)/Cys-tRNA(Cys) deacylase [Olsenella sp. KH1P3]